MGRVIAKRLVVKSHENGLYLTETGSKYEYSILLRDAKMFIDEAEIMRHLSSLESIDSSESPRGIEYFEIQVVFLSIP